PQLARYNFIANRRCCPATRRHFDTSTRVLIYFAIGGELGTLASIFEIPLITKENRMKKIALILVFTLFAPAVMTLSRSAKAYSDPPAAAQREEEPYHPHRRYKKKATTTPTTTTPAGTTREPSNPAPAPEQPPAKAPEAPK